MPKIKCPNPKHTDSNPSAEVYPDGVFCFSCQMSFPLQEKRKGPAAKKIVDNIPEKVAYIESLPTRIIRGIELPYDNFGFYIVWPDKSYYKCRVWEPGLSGKYIGPRGAKQPILHLSVASKNLLIVEGELNALTIANVGMDLDIITAGSVGNSDTLSEIIVDLSSGYEKITLWYDADWAGDQQILNLAPMLSRVDNKVFYIRSQFDANDQLNNGTLLETLNEEKTPFK